MQQKHLALMLSTAVLALAGHQSHAQQATAAPTKSAETRAQVRMEREDFVKSHRWDPTSETWVLRPEFEPPSGMKTRAQVRQDRDEFLSKNKWDPATETWIPLEKPRQISQLSREQVRRETRGFVKTHEWDDYSETWKLKRPAR